MGHDLAHAVPLLNRVFIRESQLQAANEGDLNAKMVLAHEFGHVILHRGPEARARKVRAC
jgi:predicted metalloprotease